MTVGGGAYVFDFVDNWAKLPAGWSFVEVSGVGVDSRDRVYVFNRGEHPMIVFDRDGNLLNSWGEGLFHRPHAVTMGPDETIYLADDGTHTIRKCTLDGKVLLTLGVPGTAATRFSGLPFNRCTHVAVAGDGSLYATDGYGNARIHKFSPDGTLLFSWGEPGTDPGQFNVPHNICVDRDGYLYVADRENHRIQVFDSSGRFETQWNNLYRPCALCLDLSDALGDRLYVGEVSPSLPVSEGIPNLGGRVGIYALSNRLIARMGAPLPGVEAGQFLGPHGIAIDSRGDLYVGEVTWSLRGRRLDPPRELRSLTKLVRLTPSRISVERGDGQLSRSASRPTVERGRDEG